MVRMLRPPVDFVRRLLVGHLTNRLDVLDSRAQILQDRMDTLGATVNALMAQTTALMAQNDALRDRVDALLAPSSPLRQLLDRLDLKVGAHITVDDQTHAVRVRDGYVLVPSSDATLLIMLVDSPVGSLEPGTRHVLTRLLAPGMTFVDVGANIGLHTLMAARSVGPGGCVHAFEPTPLTFNLLRRTMALNSVSEIVLAHPIALGDATERRVLFQHRVCGHNSFYSQPEANEAAGSLEVAVKTLDDVIGQRSIDIVKIDVEGAELDVLSGMTATIAANPDLAIIAEFGASHLASRGISADAWLGAFYDLGYSARIIDEVSGDCRILSLPDLMTRHSANLLFAKPDSRTWRILDR